MSEKNYDVQISYIESDIEKIQTKPNLFIQQYGPRGVFQLFKEIVQNAIDEYEDPACVAYLKSIGEKTNKFVIKITYDSLTDKVTVEDSGRGIPETEYGIEIICTKNQAGSKFFRDQGGKSSGEFGVGLTVTCALSSEFSLATYRGDYYHSLTFKEGRQVSEVRGVPKKKEKKHGTISSFIANPKYLGTGTKLPFELCIDWMEMISYQLTTNIEFDVDIYDGLERKDSIKIKRKPFSELIDRFIMDDSNIAFGPVSLKKKDSLVEEIRKVVFDKNNRPKEKKEKKKKDVNLEFAFAYDTNTIEFDCISFCNFTKTDEGGVHAEAVEESLGRFLQAKTIESMSESQKQKYPVVRADVRTGLKLVVNLSTNAQVQFMGNAKNRIQNEELKPLLKEMAKEAIEKFFEEDSSKLTTVCKIIKDNAKARIDMQKVRNATVKGRNTRFDDLELDNFVPCNNSKPNGEREIFLVEGKKSAMGALINGRDPMSQAIFGFRGQTLNPFKTTFAKFMENAEWRNYVKALRCGIGPSFNLDKLWFKRILIATDADIDGYGIGASIAGTHLMYFPEVVKAGCLYRIYPPLYHIDNAAHPFIGSKAELTEIYMKQVAKRYKIRPPKGDYLSREGLWQFMYDTLDYVFLINELNNFYKSPRYFLEAVAFALVYADGIQQLNDEYILKDGIFDDASFIKKFMRCIQKKCPEITLKGDKLIGVASGVATSLIVNDRFVNKIEGLIPVYLKYGVDIIEKEKGDEEKACTILQFLDDTYHLTPKILNRFKGLGEANADQLWETMLSPENRIMVQLTTDSIERDMEIFRKLKSDKISYRRMRKDMVESYRIHYEDIDN